MDAARRSAAGYKVREELLKAHANGHIAEKFYGSQAAFLIQEECKTGILSDGCVSNLTMFEACGRFLKQRLY